MSLNNKISSIFQIVLISVVVYYVSFLLLTQYTGGDQEHYRALYRILAGSSYIEALVQAKTTVGSAEPVTIFFLWSGAQLGLDKDVYISLFNVLLAISLFLLTKRFNVNFFVFFLLATNYYVLVLMTGAERLKFAYIFLLLAFLFERKVRKFFVFTACLSHFQVFLFLPSVFLAENSRVISRLIFNFKLSKNFLVVILIGALFLVFVLYSYSGLLYSKILAYFDLSRGLGEIFNLLVLSLIGVLSTANRGRMLYSIIPLFIFAFVFGGDRVNMIAVTFVLGLLLIEKRLFRPLPMVLLLYFSLKSWTLINNIIIYGDGFPKVA